MSFVGATTGSWVAVRYARHTAHEKAIGELSARRRLELIEQLAGLLNEAFELISAFEGAPTTRFKARDPSEMLDEFESKLPLATLYLGDDLSLQIGRVYFWACAKMQDADSRCIETGGLTEPDHQVVWDLLTDAAHGKLPSKPWRPVRWVKRWREARQLERERLAREKHQKAWLARQNKVR